MVCRAVTKIYRRSSGSVPALKEVDADLFGGEVTVLSGPSGSGKSTLLRLIAGLDKPTSGSVTVGDAWLSQLGTRDRRKVRRHSVGYVFQRPSDNLISHLTVAEHLDLTARTRSSTDRDAEDLLEMLGLAHRLHNRPHELSGGEQQRVAFAQAAAGTPRVLLADEPTAELDADSAEALIALMKQLAERGSAVVVASHEPAVVTAGDHVVELHDGEVVA